MARDFPLASRAKPPGMLHRVYRMLAKSQLNMRQRRRGGIGPGGVWGDDEVAYDTTACAAEDDGLELKPQRSMAAPEIKRLAARFAEMNVDLDAHIPVRRAPVVILPRVPPRPAGIGPPPPPRAPPVSSASPPSSGTGAGRAALLEEIRSRAAARGSGAGADRSRLPPAPEAPPAPRPGADWAALLDEIR